MKAIWVFVVIGLAAASVLPASAASKAKACKEQCAGLIATCSGTAGTFGFGDLAKACKKSVLKRCKKEGEAACASFCGNGAIDGAEKCDGAALGGATCESLGFASGTLACAIGCGFDTSGCVGFPAPPSTPLCGNGVKDENETCDGDDLDGRECTSFGFSGGELACSADCELDGRACDYAPQTIGDTTDLVGGVSFWAAFSSNSPSGFSVGDGLLIPNRGDALDSFWIMQVDGTVVNPAAPLSYIPGFTRLSVTAPAVTISGLQVAQRFTTFEDAPVLRVVLTLTNPSGVPVSVVARASGNFGSDAGTTIAGTSNGDALATTLDHWAATYDSTPNSTDPGIATVFGGPGAPAVTPTAVSLVASNDAFSVEFPVTVPADSTRRLMFFTALQFERADGALAAELFDDLDDMNQVGLLGGLTAEQKAEIVNWTLVP
jgi:hypothetical protein